MVGSLLSVHLGALPVINMCLCNDAGVTKGMAFGFELIITFVLVSLANDSSNSLQRVDTVLKMP